MKYTNLYIGLVILMLAALGLAACSGGPDYEKIEPAELVDQGDGINLLILTEKAVERLGIETDVVTEEEIFVTRTFGGEVTEASADGGALVMVRLTAEEMNSLDLAGPAAVFPLEIDDAEDEDNGVLEAEWDESTGMDDDEDGVTRELRYSVPAANGSLVAGERLMVEVSLKGDEGPRLVVPFSALIYDIYGDTWVYTNPEPLHFLRVPVVVDYVEGDQVVLLDGPAAGTSVVTVGVAELHGADTGVGK